VAAFIQEARAKNFPVEVHDYPEGRHGFGVHDDTEESRQLIARALAFVQSHMQNN
jgi:hypothetical protein